MNTSTNPKEYPCDLCGNIIVGSYRTIIELFSRFQMDVDRLWCDDCLTVDDITSIEIVKQTDRNCP